MSLVSFIGPRPNLLDLEGTSGIKRLGGAAHPSMRLKVRRISDIEDNAFHAITFDDHPVAEAITGKEKPLDALCTEAERHCQWP